MPRGRCRGGAAEVSPWARARERVHAAADAGRAGRARGGRRGSSGGRRPRRWPPSRPPRRCARGIGSATRAVRSGCTAPRSRSSSGTAARCPSDLDDLLALQGVGPYTARAVAAFAFGLRHPVVDTNTRRVIARAVLGPGRAGPAVDGARPRGDGRAAARVGCRGAHVQRRRPWSSGRRCAPRARRAATRARSPRRAPGGGRATRPTRARARPGRRGSRAPTGRCAAS